ncbi:hypothetical protein PCORN_01825 [Listeria cornellensis FSL F6-0969]|uniref:Uncharacterized protein n=1 Tax=Listeria cornellensis FSL F6-0969 TaxID=1265820 RepID=W7CA82_9LIST|nr:hypothetical protein PCORN_01825 [Listeria cornellensis FSL F6-0969]
MTPLAGREMMTGVFVCSENWTSASLACLVPTPARITGFFAELIRSAARAMVSVAISGLLCW